jgi:predicted transcriptional regulator
MTENNLSTEYSIKKLVEFGLTENEATVYIYLLERGSEAGGSKIALGTKLHRQYVYLAVPHLLELGLVEEIAHGKQNKYKARPPQEIEKIGRKRAIMASDLARELNVISNIGNEQEFEVIQGAKAIQQYEYDYVMGIKEHQEQYIIGGNTEGFVKMMGETLDEYLLTESRKRILTYYLGHKSEKDLWYKGFLSNNDYRFKFIEKLPQGVTHMVVRKDQVLFYSFLNPPLLYVIKSPVVSANYRDFFMMLWDMARE